MLIILGWSIVSRCSSTLLNVPAVQILKIRFVTDVQFINFFLMIPNYDQLN